MSVRRVLALFCTASVLAGCGGSAVVPLTPSGASPGGAVAEKFPATFHIRVPHKRRHAHFVSPSTQGITIAISGPTNIKVTGGLTPSSPGCSNGLSSTICSFTYKLKPGKYSATIATYDAVSCTTSCSIPVGAKRLSAAQGVAFTVKAGTANAISLILSAIPSALSVIPLTNDSVVNAGQGIDLLGTSAHRLMVQATDPDGNIIFGAGSPSYAVSQTGGSLPMTLGQPGAASPNTFTIAPPAAYNANTATVTVQATYAGQATNGCAQPGAACSKSVVVDMKELIAVGNNNNTVDIFELGSTTPYATLSFGIANPNAILFDHSGNLIVANCLQGCTSTSSTDNIAIFAPPYTGVPTFISSGVVGPQAMVLDQSGNLYVANCSSCHLGGTDSVTKYLPPFSNSSLPAATVTNGIEDPVSIAVDTAGNLWVANCFTCVGSSGDTVTSYAPPYNGTPTHTLLHNVSVPSSIALDPSNNLFVANRGTATVAAYVAPSYTDDSFVPLIATIGSTYGGSGNLSNPTMVLAAGSSVWVADNGSGNGAVLRCGAPFQSATPNCGSNVVTITTGVNNPQFIAIDGSGTVFVANGNVNNVTSYASPAFSTPVTLSTNPTQPFAVTILP